MASPCGVKPRSIRRTMSEIIPEMMPSARNSTSAIQKYVEKIFFLRELILVMVALTVMKPRIEPSVSRTGVRKRCCNPSVPMASEK